MDAINNRKLVAKWWGYNFSHMYVYIKEMAAILVHITVQYP